MGVNRSDDKQSVNRIVNQPGFLRRAEASLQPSGTCGAVATADGSGSSAILFQAGTRYPALFCVPGIFGGLWGFQKLARKLGPEFTVYGLQPLGLDGGVAPCASIGELAEHYLREVRSVQSAGPYYLAGFSLGGTVAYEIAQRLVAQGEKVDWLVLLDPPTRSHRGFVRVLHQSAESCARRAAFDCRQGRHDDAQRVSASRVAGKCNDRRGLMFSAGGRASFNCQSAGPHRLRSPALSRLFVAVSFDGSSALAETAL